MRGRQSPVESILTLPRVDDPAERRARWRQAITALGQQPRADGPPPLDGLATERIVASARTALDTGLVDDMDFIAPGAAAVALYELSAALPPGQERRDIGRRVFARLFEGTAATFATVATRMALGTGRPLETATMRARIALVFSLPTGSAVNADPLALTLVSRRELFERWVARGARGPLPARRLAARLLEHASREAVRRSQQGDPHPAEMLMSDSVRPVYEDLLADREPLVWRHAAVGRGLLSTVDSALREEIDLALDPSLSPTEWRRAGISLVACLVGDFDNALSQCKRLVEGEMAAQDPGLIATMAWGLPAVIHAEPDAAAELLEYLSFCNRQDVAESIASVLAEVENQTFGVAAAERIRSLVLDTARGSDPTMQAILEDTLRGLDRRAPERGVSATVRRAVRAYVSHGARAAHDIALQAVERAHTTMDAIEALSLHGAAALPEVIGPLTDIDASALETSRLHDLLLLGKPPGDASASIPEMDRLYDRVGRWILDGEERYIETEYSRGEMLARQRTLRALLHLVDLETSGRSDGNASASRLKARVRRAIDVLMSSVAAGPDASVHRIFCATLARSFDAAVREGLADPADLLLLAVDQLSDNHSVQAMMEASTNPDVRQALGAYSSFLASSSRDAMESIADGTFDARQFANNLARGDEMRVARQVVELSRGFGTNGSYRGEALRQVVLRIGRALETVSAARGLTELVEAAGAAGDPILALEMQIQALRQLIDGARRRILEAPADEFEVVADVAPLSALIERAVAGVPPNALQLSMSIGELTAPLPAPLAAAVSAVLGRLGTLPVAAPSDISVIPLKTQRAEVPDWLLPRRTIGGFYVVRALGSGGVSSVFVARRLEERDRQDADLYALKVPIYDPTTARSLSEQEFMQMFREEAGALLALPQHDNLARFVTFDAAARPKPILVMELIRGFGLDRLIRNHSLSMRQVIRYLDGLLSGLGAMHSVGVGHLDVKPSNVILRDEDTPVLVDFGLSGRQIRPGCGTLEYCAPEILGVTPGHGKTLPSSADMYAFACAAFELLTGDLLFDAEDEMTLMTRHVQHDGWPPKLSALSNLPGCADLCVVLAACLRHDPADRPTAEQAQEALASASRSIAHLPWPLVLPEMAADMTA